jgi:hypothetical protein
LSRGITDAHIGLEAGALRGYCTVQFGSGVVIRSIAIYAKGEHRWASPPKSPWVRGISVVTDTDGKPKRLTLIDFANHGVQRAWSRCVLAALDAQHPGALDGEVK